MQDSGAGQDTFFVTDDRHKGMYVIGLSGLYDYDGQNAAWQSHVGYFLSPSKVTQDGHKVFFYFLFVFTIYSKYD